MLEEGEESAELTHLDTTEGEKMNALISLIQSHPTYSALLAYITFSSFVSAIPEPQPTDSKGYVILYRFLHGFAANWDKVGLKVPKG